RQRPGGPEIARPLEPVAEIPHAAQRRGRNAVRERAEAEEHEERDRRDGEIASAEPWPAARAIEDGRLRPGGRREPRQDQRFLVIESLEHGGNGREEQ